MALYIIGLGLGNEKDISVNAQEQIKNCSTVYLEDYTSILQCTKEDIEKQIGKKIVLAPRTQMENDMDKIIEKAKEENVAVLIVGDPLSATTHFHLFMDAKKKGIEVQVFHNASILTAVGITGFQLYKFGKTTSIPFADGIETPYNVVKENKEQGLHTLLLLDLQPRQNKFLSIKEALGKLLTIEKKRDEKIISEDTIVIGTARLGSKNFIVKAGKVGDIQKHDFGPAPYCLIIPGKLHFVEEEAIEFWK